MFCNKSCESDDKTRPKASGPDEVSNVLQACAQLDSKTSPGNVWGTSHSARALRKTLHEYTFSQRFFLSFL